MYKRLVILSAIILVALCGLVWLDEFMAREEKRPYTEYQNYYVPDNTVAGQQQMPVVRSPLAGKLGQDLAYGQFQIEPDGSIITPNDKIMALTDADQDGDFYAQVGLNKDNVRYNLLPALTQVKTGSLYTAYPDKASVPLSEQVVEQLTKVMEQNEKTQRQGGKSKAAQTFRGKNFPIESFQNPDLGAQVISRNRAFIRQDEMSNAILPQLFETSQPAASTMQRELDETQSSSAKADHATQGAAGYARIDMYEEKAVEKAALDAEAVSQVAVEVEAQQKKEAEEQITSQQPEPAATRPVLDRRVAESYRRQTTAPGRTQPAPARQTADMSTQGDRTTQPPEQQSRMIQMQVESTQEDLDMVQVRIEPFVRLKVPCKEGEESVFGGQVFMLRHIQIEDKHFVQGFQLNEKELIGEVEESAQRFMRQGMNYELAQQANGTSAFTAILDFGFGDLILNLIEIDPQRIARKISGMRIWYFGIITVVLLAVTLGLASLWRNTQAQLRLARKKDDFISAVSHELRTPLTSIRMYSEMLEKNWVKSKDKVAEYYKNMRQESERLSRLIENVLDFSRIQRGKKRYDFNLGDINKCIADVVEMMRPYAAQNGFSIETQLGELGPTTFDGDAVTQIIVNLLDNAIKYARDAEDKTVIVRTKGDHEFIIIEVEDHGPGVPHRQRKKIFEQFYRIGAESTRETTGTGLGLALVKRFAQAHNGSVEIINARPSGAIFRVAIAAQA